MAITPGWTSTPESKEVEQEYIDKGAVTSVQYNPTVDAKYQAAKAQAYAADFVEWPTKIHANDEGY